MRPRLITAALAVAVLLGGCADDSVERERDQLRAMVGQLSAQKMELARKLTDQEGATRAHWAYMEAQAGWVAGCRAGLNICPPFDESAGIKAIEAGFSGVSSLQYWLAIFAKVMVPLAGVGCLITALRVGWVNYGRPAVEEVAEANRLVEQANEKVEKANLETQQAAQEAAELNEDIAAAEARIEDLNALEKDAVERLEALNSEVTRLEAIRAMLVSARR